LKSARVVPHIFVWASASCKTSGLFIHLQRRQSPAGKTQIHSFLESMIGIFSCCLCGAEKIKKIKTTASPVNMRLAVVLKVMGSRVSWRIYGPALCNDSQLLLLIWRSFLSRP
jgi:hypothetical protein